MTQNKGKGRAGDDLSQLRSQLGRSTPVSQGAEPEQEREIASASRRSRGESKPAAGGDDKPRRITVDLNTERHRVLRDFAFNERVKGTEVLRGLLDELAEDQALAARLRERLENTT